MHRELERALKVRLHRPLDQGRRLLMVDDAAPEHRDLGVGYRASSPENLSRVDRIEQRQGAQQLRLARSGGTGEGDSIRPVNTEIDRVEQQPTAVATARDPRGSED